MVLGHLSPCANYTGLEQFHAFDLAVSYVPAYIL